MQDITSVTHTNPYPGLRPYQATEQTKFYGRDADTQALLEKILANRLTLLFAATGVGKSSLLQAAILPKLSSTEGLALDVVYYNDWVAPPVQGLQAAIRAALIARYDALPNTDNANLEAFFRAITPNTSHPLVIILDQFEEFFRYRFIHHAADFQPFIDQLTEVILAAELKVSLVFSMREDFALELNAFKPHLPNPLFSNYYRLEKLGVDAARAAITEPLIQAGYQYEPALLDKLLTDLLSRDLTRDAASLAKGTQADSVEPPYLQIVCSQLWELDKNDPQKTLRLATYNKAGGAKGLLENYVNFVMKSFSDRENQVASKAFDHLISRRGTKMAHTPEDLAELVNLKPAELANVMDKLEKARILRRQQRDQQVWYELYHDMFSGGIESWNTAWKNHMRVRRTLIGTGASLAALAMIYFGVVAYLQGSSKHLRLGNGNNDRVEIYTGTSKFPDPFGQQHYFSETGFERGQLELDKRYPKRDIPDYPLVVRDLTSSQPLDARVSQYISNGELCQYSDLLTQILPIEQASPGCKANASKPRTTELSSKEAAKASLMSTNPSLSPDSDPMLQTMLNRLPDLKTEWGFEQLQVVEQLFPQFSMNMGGNLSNNALYMPTTYTKEQSFNQALTQAGMAMNDPRQLELLLEWLLDPSLFNTSQPIRPLDLATSLTDGARGSAKNILPTVMQVMQLKPRLLQALASDNLQQREVAIILSGATADPSFFEPLAKLLNDKASSTRQFALKSLISIDPERAIPLSANLLNDRSQPTEIRMSLIMSLGESASLKAIPALLARFQDKNEREELRMLAGSSLGNLGDVSVWPALRAVLSDQNERTEARLGAIEGLRYSNDQASTSLLLERLNDVEERLDVRNSCAGALGELAVNEATPSFLALIEDPNVDENLKSSAVFALSASDQPDVVPRLLAVWKNLPPNSYVALQIGSVLSSFNTDDPQIVDMVKSNPQLATSLWASAKARLASEAGSQIHLPQYEPINPIIPANVLHGINDGTYGGGSVPISSLGLSGTYPQKQALITALMIKDTNRNPALARLALDETNSISIRLRALNEITDTSITPELIQALQPLAQHKQRSIRIASSIALLRIAEGKSLLTWLSSNELNQDQLELGLARLAVTGSREEAIASLLKFAKDDSSTLQAKAYQLLGELKATEALPLLASNLATLEDEYQTWRAIRDQQPIDTTNEDIYKTWQQKFTAAQPAHAALATHYGYALAQIDTQQGIEALTHDLADVRTGASLAFNQAATPADLQSIANARAERKTDPLFQQASYLALDKALARLESSTDPKDIQALEKWQSQVKNQTDAVSQRLDWTLRIIKHYQNLDQEFAQKYKLKRSN